LLLLAALLSIHITERKPVFVQACRLAHLSVGLSVCWSVRLVNNGEPTDWMIAVLGGEWTGGVGQGMYFKTEI